MSNGSAALAMALGAGAGLGLWHLLRKEDDSPTSLAAPAGTATACVLRLDASGLTAGGETVDVPTAVTRCKSAGRVELIVSEDAPGATFTDLSTALADAGVVVNQRRNGRSRRGARRNHRYTREGRTILRDGVPVLQLGRVDLGDQRYAISPHETDVLAEEIVRLLDRSGRRRQAASSDDPTPMFHRFALRTYPDGRTRWYVAESPTTWEEAKRRLVAAGVLDDRVMLPTEWKLVGDPPFRVPASQWKSLPGGE